MILTRKYINHLKLIDRLSSYTHYDAAQKLKDVTIKSICKQDTDNLNILSGVLSMYYNTNVLTIFKSLII